MAWIAPDDVLGRALQTLLSNEPFGARVCLIRDNRGRVRVALERCEGKKTNAKNLEAILRKEIGGWFAGPVVDGNGSPAHRRISQELFANPQPWPLGWPAKIEMADASTTDIPVWLIGKVILQSKESWLGRPSNPPEQIPRVVSFYSFKGGVGRTTTLCCVAARLAKPRGLKVVALDLDVEAPGTGSFLGAHAHVGVVDHLLSHLATGEIGDVEPELVEGFDNLWVMPAGQLDAGYLEKLSRLDFLSAGADGHPSPAEAALRALVSTINSRLEPDVILLDCRAGLHDIGGLALHRLSHADMLVARANPQAQDGMRIVLDAIHRFGPASNRQVRLVQTMVPFPFGNEDAQRTIKKWRGEMYDLFRHSLYEDLEDEDMPAEDQEAAHFPLLVGERAELSKTSSLALVGTDVLAHFDPIADAVVLATDLAVEGES